MRFVSLAFLFTMLAWQVGCTAKNAPAPPTVKVSGTVKLDGKAMTGGEVRFSVPGQPGRIFEIKDGAFSGDAFIGKSQIEVVWEQDGPPNPTDPTVKMKVNTVSSEYSGINSKLNAEVTAAGTNQFSFEVTSAKK